jgi:hypothetical protein
VARSRLEAWRELDRSLRLAHAREAVGQMRLAAPLKAKAEAVTEDFLTVRLDCAPGAGLWRVQLTAPGQAKVLINTATRAHCDTTDS